jgi:enoyl-[acyl-carrier protein] reductase I
MLAIDLAGKRALVAGIADASGFGFSIAKSLAQAGASVAAATWPPALRMFQALLKRGKLDAARTLADGSLFEFESIYPLDAAFDTMDQVSEPVRNDRRYAGSGDFTIHGLTRRIEQDWGQFDILIHALANGPEVARPLLDTSRQGYLAAISVSAFSLVSMVARLGPLMRPGASVISLSYLAGERTVVGYGGGMSSAKAALESDTRVLAYEAGRRWGLRINTVSAGPLASRAANVTGIIRDLIRIYAQCSPLPEAIRAEEVAHATTFLASALASGVTGTTLYVDKGFHSVALSDAMTQSIRTPAVSDHALQQTPSNGALSLSA